MTRKKRKHAYLKDELLELRQRLDELAKSEEKREQAEKQLRESEEKYKNIVELAPDGIITVNLKGVVKSCNSSFLKLAGYSLKEVVGRHFTKLDTLPAQDVSKYIKIFKSIITGKVPKPFEIRWIHKDGTSHWGEIHVCLMKSGRKTVGVQAIVRDVTERKKTEESIRESEERYKILVTTSPAAITATDLEGNITFVSPRTLKIHGFNKPSELLGKSAFEFFAPEDQKKAMENTKKTLKKGYVRDVEYTMLRKDGSRFKGELNASVVKDAQGKPKAFIATVRDITERKKSEEALKESEEKYRAIFESFHDVYYRTDREGRVTIISPSVKTQAGYDPEDVIGHFVTDFYVIPEERKAFTEELKKCGYINDYEIKLRGKDGRVIDVSVSSKIIFGKDGYPEGVEGVLRDITERKKTEKALRESEEKYRCMVEHSLQGIVIVQDFRIVYSNSAFAKISGYTAEELLALSPEEVKELVHPDDRNLVWGRMKKRLQGEEVPSRYEFRAIKKDGTVIWLQMVASRIEYRGKLAVQGAFLDITDRIRAEEEINQSYIRLRKIFDEMVNALASAVEMRDPFTAGHQQRVAKLASAIAEALNLTEEQNEGIRTAGLIHDIGKIYVPAEILSKPIPLTDAEKSLVQNHAQVGHDILKGIEFPWPVAEIVLQHHERMLGSGYPQGLSGEDILLEARILGVADVVETMYSHRPYRAAFGLDKALREISQNRSILYDPKVVDVCLDLFMNKGFKFEQDIGLEVPLSDLSRVEE